ncbi:hypothetical protein FC47_GL001264 [Limosilactobacillus mucosae DSM 13345]|uniref:Uncharacterized protein n=1 Tax=Limosilactobacillus mucosae DSM 13345 TaxID=1423771 RepID=A0A0R1PAG9_LIMMU|nr:hypothetical protein FC47_GL001264 [Limosilactobacillus mucosae DSM 13345]
MHTAPVVINSIIGNVLSCELPSMKQASSSINWQIHHQDLLGTDFNFQWNLKLL